MPLDPRVIIDQLSTVQRLVHLAARFDSVDEERLRVELLSVRRKAYNDELGIQAGKVGCPGQIGRLGNGNILSVLNEASKMDSASIVNTYNYFLALEIQRAGQENPRGNRNYYAAKVMSWNPGYWSYKYPQIVQVAELTARNMAQQDFYQYNGSTMGSAKLEPTSAVCPICAGWIARGIVSLRVALSNPANFHVNCPHIWDIRPSKVAKEDCPMLWMGA